MKPIFWILLILPMVLVASTLWGNRAPLFAPPGPWVRLKTYLGSNWACTAPEHPFPELRQPLFDLPADRLQALVEQALQGLGWRYRRLGAGHLHAEVVTPLLHFTDDLDIRILPEGPHSHLQLCSRSRVGRADFAANQRHILDLLDQVHRQAEALSR
ncbi:MAG: DUF1499 domain-containing protein [Gammaproteobacteria bacterium]|nr:MAG: DUF1499 domain-containing protein [Gammaproteobacteria bacterium]